MMSDFIYIFISYRIHYSFLSDIFSPRSSPFFMQLQINITQIYIQQQSRETDQPNTRTTDIWGEVCLRMQYRSWRIKGAAFALEGEKQDEHIKELEGKASAFTLEGEKKD
jgi:hypothetical protein